MYYFVFECCSCWIGKRTMRASAANDHCLSAAHERHQILASSAHLHLVTAACIRFDVVRCANADERTTDTARHSMRAATQEFMLD